MLVRYQSSDFGVVVSKLAFAPGQYPIVQKLFQRRDRFLLNDTELTFCQAAPVTRFHIYRDLSVSLPRRFLVPHAVANEINPENLTPFYDAHAFSPF
jgi:hypothetical protein